VLEPLVEDNVRGPGPCGQPIDRGEGGPRGWAARRL